MKRIALLFSTLLVVFITYSLAFAATTIHCTYGGCEVWLYTPQTDAGDWSLSIDCDDGTYWSGNGPGMYHGSICGGVSVN